MSLKKIKRISEIDNSRSAMRNLGVNLFQESECKVIDRNTYYESLDYIQR